MGMGVESCGRVSVPTQYQDSYLDIHLDFGIYIDSAPSSVSSHGFIFLGQLGGLNLLSPILYSLLLKLILIPAIIQVDYSGSK